MLVKLSNTYTQTLQFELQPTQLESNEVMVSKDAKTINVTLSGKGFELLKYYVEARIIDVDFSQLNKDKGKLNKLGKNIGKAVGVSFKAQFLTDIAEAIAEVGAVTTAAVAETKPRPQEPKYH